MSEILLDETNGNLSIFIADRSLELKNETTGMTLWATGDLKVSGGIRNFYGWFDSSMSVEDVLRAVKRNLRHNWVVLSKRPYRLGQACDGTIEACVSSLFIRFCKDFEFSPELVHRRAYLEQGKADYQPFDLSVQEAVVERGEWQGVEYPENWDKTALCGLIRSLQAVNYHRLNDVLCQMPVFDGFDWATMNFSESDHLPKI